MTMKDQAKDWALIGELILALDALVKHNRALIESSQLPLLKAEALLLKIRENVSSKLED